MKELWCDYDGTVVHLKGLFDPRTWPKFSQPLKPGYLEFLAGADEYGVGLTGIASKRPETPLTRFLTCRSLGKFGLGHIADGSVVLAGGEVQKARHLIERADENEKIGFIDNNPHLVGAELIQTLAQTKSPHDITLGAVNHSKSPQQVAELHKLLQADDNTSITNFYKDGFSAQVGFSTLKIYNMPPYSISTGQRFAEIMHLQ